MKKKQDFVLFVGKFQQLCARAVKYTRIVLKSVKGCTGIKITDFGAILIDIVQYIFYKIKIFHCVFIIQHQWVDFDPYKEIHCFYQIMEVYFIVNSIVKFHYFLIWRRLLIIRWLFIYIVQDPRLRSTRRDGELSFCLTTTNIWSKIIFKNILSQKELSAVSLDVERSCIFYTLNLTV